MSMMMQKPFTELMRDLTREDKEELGISLSEESEEESEESVEQEEEEEEEEEELEEGE
eukprot:CAMPEP_0201511462 /NCGR_PEP_ID=MMETSP0161_2-20130828/3921_1 /ASSEMBLY_ACC=CAM_ASM_000251 /TAXON_ID=180227 /ORGANISM="Neoparamoeba aestuarina, Strain SoJaBio B1-5/56/2" /LENGTH=57 /DNA_ID=CAMNT_0047906965 /DNA_START=54 /DNA_END=224 /DNA_ORIENTATION=-